jgi:hypothetical protein
MATIAVLIALGDSAYSAAQLRKNSVGGLEAVMTIDGTPPSGGSLFERLGMSRCRTLLVLNVLAALVLSAAVAMPAAAGQPRQRCCFFLTADSDAVVEESYDTDTTRGTQEGIVSWLLVGIFRYREQGGFWDLTNVGPAHEHGIRSTSDDIRNYSRLQNPPDTVGTPVAEPGTCGVLKRKRIERYPNVDLFRGKVLVSVQAYEDPGCMYGLSMINWRINSGPEGYNPWGDEFRAPPRNFFRNGRGTFRRRTDFTSTYSPNSAFGVSTIYDHAGFLKIEWFPPRALPRRIKQVRSYHQNYNFGDLCSHIPCE